MNQAEYFKDHWKTLRDQVRATWTSLSASDIDAIDGNLDVLTDLLRERYSLSDVQAETQVENFLDGVGIGEPERKK